ncbi:glyoxylate/hydroxypyruvate reductase A-like [Saccostrea cucullata]|uniref:glyoxylate/hydroxypyruvate reductase A-like n=2 Tax=Saccostrea cuccullata TaxID=36930 RepID=UPI002ED0B20D
MTTKHVICVSSTVPRLSSVVRQLLPSAEVIDATPDTDGKFEIPLNTEVLFGDTPSIISHIKKEKGELKWAQSTWAGVESIFKAFTKPPEGVILTRMGEGFGRLMAEYVVGHIFVKELSVLNLHQQQKEKLWDKSPVQGRRLLTSLTIGILGVGSISTEIARLCKAVGMTVWGLSRSTKKHIPAFDHLTTLADLSSFLAGCDYICNVLPGTPETTNMLSGDVLKCCKSKRPIFINVGRGSIISEESLLSALENKWIGGALLDVFSKEPLPPESPLWSHSCVTVTPHISGPSVAESIAEAFVKNYEKYTNKQRLNYIIDWTKGY